MFTLQKLNVVRIVEDELQKAKLVAEGFIEIVEEIQKEEPVIEQITEQAEQVAEVATTKKGKA